MCGIYASFSLNAEKRVFEGLKRIEYRGYDSWGVATLVDGKLELKKEVGKLSGQKNIKFAESKLCLGHTRWATHGEVTKINAHPHLAKNKSFALVQNGVVENYQEHKSKLIDDGYNFISKTDTEIIVGLLEKEMEHNSEKNLSTSSFINVFNKLAGRNTVVVITTQGRIMAIRDGSPLVVGRNSKRELYFSSDVLSMSPDVDEYLVINSGQIAVFNSSDSCFEITDIKTGKRVGVEFIPLEHKLDLANITMDIGKDSYESYMFKEIHEQSNMLLNVIRDSKQKFAVAVEMIKNARQVFTLGCGSASYATGNTAYLLRKIGILALTVEAYEANSYLELLNNGSEKSVCIVFSQSGETADTNEVVELMKRKGVKIISVVNMPGSTLTQLSNLSFMLQVGPELAVASTKAFLGQALWGIIISDILSGSKFNDLEIKINEFEYKLKEWFANKKIQNNIKKIAKNLTKHEHVFVLGRGDLYYAGLESALKLKEISYIHAEGFSSGELKHGVIALISKGTPVLCLVAEDENKANMLSAISEVRARGGKTIVIAKENNELYSNWIQLPDTNDYIFLSSIIPSQLMTCYMAVEKGYDVDKPRNLAKSVTVK
ncbi:glutamine--fructose-6-phosphate transaminase (isomerizing) [Patescibacteria group bacterium]|nr:glutamine--fructose-6-phosphate transaminase (isomerizing) [Patescibacteria group bacterium]